MSVQGDVTRHCLVEVVLRAAVLGGVPALERVAGAGRVRWLHGLGPVPHRLGSDRGSAVRIERHRGICSMSCLELNGLAYVVIRYVVIQAIGLDCQRACFNSS